MMEKTGNDMNDLCEPRMKEVCAGIMAAREGRKLAGEAALRRWARELAIAAANEVEQSAGYDPECDHRALWARAAIESARSGRKGRTDAGMEAMARMLIGKPWV